MMVKNRTFEQVKEHYEIEKELASKLRNASQPERRYLYSSLYDELFRRVPHHTQLTRKSSPQEKEMALMGQMRYVKPFLNKNVTFLEIGPGDCALSIEVAKLVKQVYAVDVSEEITRALTPPPNFELFLSDGCSVPVPPNSVNIAFSNQLMEHLHPDDATEQLKNIYHALVPGGTYICITPNRLSGPHDISGYFDEVATGFHLKEYSISELSPLFKDVGFSRVRVYIGAKGRYISTPVTPLIYCEQLLDKLPYPLRKRMARSILFRLLLGIRLVATK